MPCRLYRNHVIITFPSFDTASSAWAPQAEISWCLGPAREFEFVRFPSRLPSEGEAMAYAVKKGEEWIDRRLSRIRRGIGARRARLEQLIEGHGAERFAGKPRASDAIAESGRQSLSFAQFKSAITKGGLDADDELLKKSYAALLRLRSQQRWSWAEARRRVAQSQKGLKARSLPHGRWRAVGLPLTEREWRRVG